MSRVSTHTYTHTSARARPSIVCIRRYSRRTRAPATKNQTNVFWIYGAKRPSARARARIPLKHTCIIAQTTQTNTTTTTKKQPNRKHPSLRREAHAHAHALRFLIYVDFRTRCSQHLHAVRQKPHSHTLSLSHPCRPFVHLILIAPFGIK